jgi:hypothetical protein
MKKVVVTKISEGLGNQLFMYANSYSLSKKNDLDFLIDPFSGYYQKKHIYNFLLDRFNISSPIASKKYVFDSFLKNFLKKILLFIDKFKINKNFIFEKRKKNKLSYYSPINIENTCDHFFLDGNFESEKYFSDYREDLLNEFSIKNDKQFSDNEYLNLIKNKNVISICVRQNRFSERLKNRNSDKYIHKSRQFVENTIEYINKAKIYFKEVVKDPLYLVWSNDFNNLDKYFNSKNHMFVINEEDKIITDFYLLTKCKYFIVGPSSFSWWGAWLSTHKDKICVRPENINPSNNTDFWPENWLKI